MIIIDKHGNKKSLKDWQWLFSLLTYHDAPLFPYVNHVMAQNGCVYTTDGHRVHCLELDELTNPIPIEPGTYRVAFNPAEFILIPETVKYPDIESLWPKEGNGERRINLFDTMSRVLTVLNTEAENLFNVDYLQDALGIKRDGAAAVSARAVLYGIDQPVGLFYEPRKALVMPMRG